MAPQAAADASAVGSLVPMVALGVPGSPTSAVIMAGLFIWGLQPGPLLFIDHPDFVLAPTREISRITFEEPVDTMHVLSVLRIRSFECASPTDTAESHRSN